MEILLFGITRDIVGDHTLVWQGAKPESVGQLRKMLIERYPEFQSLSSLAIAVNSELTSEDHPVSDTDELALIPPVSGG
ncbi:MoaD/ThiS family protein [Robertkochia solimangrovi]|uniref:MoaD/ThiS family protein n=1 Tax=Robertkochia solimangrovi TaxID=2213046 RepID=UPI00117FE587|nr:MoaD/ThiS family protein [Robertkochia solimangrovi]TRZ43274.1 molybdopterin synthase sulfur carrier subunit [Robertkochia solimangrovi]